MITPDKIAWYPSRIAAARAEKRRSRYFLRLDLWGFVSIMLALLFIVIGDTTPDQHLRALVDLPAARNAILEPHALREDAIRVNITRDGRFFFRDSEVDVSHLGGEVRDALRNGSEKSVYLHADARVRYADVKAVLDQIRAVGIQNVIIVSRKGDRY